MKSFKNALLVFLQSFGIQSKDFVYCPSYSHITTKDFSVENPAFITRFNAHS